MHTEHLTHVRPTRVLGAWLIAIAVASLIGLLIAAAGAEDGPGEAGAALAVIVGFFAGGFFAGFRAMHAPILHGVALGLFSLVAWVALNVVARGATPGFGWEALTPTGAGAILLAQMGAGVAGAWTGYAVALRGQPEPDD